MAYNAIQIAKYIINNAECGINNLVLQKIMYYVQAAFLVERNKQCFGEKLCAWESGPAVKGVYDEFMVYGRDVIPPQEQTD
ncbi:MAG: Panacea domain-containing protein [Lachnospiraceae bacterium]